MTYFDLRLMSVSVNFGSIAFYAILLIILCWSYWYGSRPRGLPPGPFGLPILGYLPFLRDQTHLQFQKMGAKYGSIFSFYLGGKLAVVLNDYDAINDAYVKQGEVFSGRPKLSGFDLNAKKFLSIQKSDGQHFKEHHRFVLSSFRDLGLGKSSIEPKILEEVGELCNEFRKHKEQPMDIAELLGLSTSNVICILLFGKRFAYDDEFLISRQRANLEYTRRADSLSVSNFLPWIMSVPIVSSLLDQRSKLKGSYLEMLSVGREIVKMYKTSSEGRCDNYVDLYLAEKSRREALSGQPETLFTDETLAQNVVQFFKAGGESGKCSLLWAIVYLLNNPNIQRKLHNEIDEAIGHFRLPSWSDRSRTPYVEATIFELQRMSSLVTFNAIHRNISTVQLHGYTIPKDSFVIANIYNVHHDPKLWKDPDQFKPERFLNDAMEAVKPDYLIPFSIGKRLCIGEGLARMELYLYFTTMLQQFAFTLPDGTSKPPSMEPQPKCNIARIPQRFQVCCIPRH